MYVCTNIFMQIHVNRLGPLMMMIAYFTIEAFPVRNDIYEQSCTHLPDL